MSRSTIEAVNVELAKLHLPALGAARNVLAQEQAVFYRCQGGRPFRGWALLFLSRKPQSRALSLRAFDIEHEIPSESTLDCYCSALENPSVPGSSGHPSWDWQQASHESRHPCLVTRLISAWMSWGRQVCQLCPSGLKLRIMSAITGTPCLGTDIFVSSASNFNTTLDHMKKLMNNSIFHRTL